MLPRTAFLRIATILILVMAIMMPFLVAAPVFAQSVSISVSSASPGTEVTISGSAFNIGDNYQITFAPGTIYEELLVPTTVISGTSFSAAVIIPHAPWGQYTIRVSSNRGNFSLFFQIISTIELNSSSGFVGDTLVVSGAGFRASRTTVNVFFNNSNIVNSSTNADGVMAAVSFQVPAIRGGSYNVYAADGVATSLSVAFVVRPHLVASLLQGSPGDQVRLDGTGFDDNSGINIYWNNQLVSTSAITSNGAGSFTTNIIVPPSTRGTHTIRARDNNLDTDSVSFLVNPKIVVNPGSGSTGQIVTVTGSGFRANGSINMSYDGTTLSIQPAAITTDTNGSFTATFTVPSILQGNYTIRASDGVYFATATFMIASKIELFPSNGNIGTEVLVNGSGFTPRGRVILSYDNQTLMTITADSTGTFSVSFTVPVSKAGAHNIAARDLSTQGIVATTTFTMESTPPPEPLLLEPVDGSMTDTQPAFSWTAVSDPSGVTYDLQIARDVNFSNLVFFKQGLAQPSYQIGQSEKLELTKKANSYYWRVRAVDGASNASNWTSPDSFYTEDSTPPPVPTLLTPQNGSRKSGGVLFEWTDVSDPSGVTYTLQVAQDSGFNYIVVYKEGLNTSHYQLTDIEKLAPTTGNPPSPYYWRVRAIDGAENQSAWSNINAFYVGGFLQLQGWPLYIIMAIAGVLLVLIGVFVGMRIRPAKPKAS